MGTGTRVKKKGQLVLFWTPNQMRRRFRNFFLPPLTWGGGQLSSLLGNCSTMMRWILAGGDCKEWVVPRGRVDLFIYWICARVGEGRGGKGRGASDDWWGT